MKVLFLCAHPDDLEFSIPSLMLTMSCIAEDTKKRERCESLSKAIIQGSNHLCKKMKASEIAIKVASMTRGEMSKFTDRVKSTKKAAIIRSHELEGSQLILTGKIPDFLGFVDGYIRITDDTIKSVKNYFELLKPDIIIAPEPIYTWYHHPDHVRTGKIAYFAIRRIIKETEKNNIDKKIPRLFYFQSIWNDWYFPRFPSHQKAINKALKEHKSQAAILIEAKIPGFLEKIIHGLKIQNCPFGESLRYQPIMSIQNQNKHAKHRFDKHHKRFKNLGLIKRLIYYATTSIFNVFEVNEYDERYQFFDGTLDPRISKSWE
ncbi:MAG: hypothetical protein GF364_14155 [Candidatus Lokiarchaeota archaeon]|nr:hypothetical protein [Candidatus Lokiarchaeota archaeon]